ncbi:MAG TPA: alpha/beta hydrolase [Nitrospirales bacterium]
MSYAQRRVIFLPGASGDGRFWQPVAERLPPCTKIFIDYPGAGRIPHSPLVRSFDDLVAMTMRHMDRPVDLVAQSMGGVVAVRAALRRPQRVRRLVLTATSGGVNFKSFNHREWRDQYRREYPSAADWVTAYRVDLTDQFSHLNVPTLLLWSDTDEISPLAVGKHLATLLPHADLVVVRGGDHMFARDRADEVAPYIARHLFSRGHDTFTEQLPHDIFM